LDRPRPQSSRSLRIRLLVIGFVVALLLALAIPAMALAATAQLTVYATATGTASAFNISGHSWISVKNDTTANIQVLGVSISPGYELYMGTYGNQGANTVWWNLEPHNASTYAGRVSLTQSLSSSQFSTLVTWINGHRFWKLLQNCAWWAASAWNTVSTNKVSAGIIPTPSQLKSSIMSKTGWISNKPWGNWSGTWGHW
jgi:hypothetical protein